LLTSLWMSVVLELWFRGIFSDTFLRNHISYRKTRCWTVYRTSNNNFTRWMLDTVALLCE
jgi:hypothetical protein